MSNYSEKLKSPKWQKKRLEILKRDEFSCQLCGDEESTLHVHHIGYSSDPIKTPNELLITLCESCHSEEEELLREVYKNINKELRNKGFMSPALMRLPDIFTKDRGWTHYDAALDVLKMAIDDDMIWDALHDEFFKRLSEKNKRNG